MHKHSRLSTNMIFLIIFLLAIIINFNAHIIANHSFTNLLTTLIFVGYFIYYVYNIKTSKIRFLINVYLILTIITSFTSYITSINLLEGHLITYILSFLFLTPLSGIAYIFKTNWAATYTIIIFIPIILLALNNVKKPNK